MLGWLERKKAGAPNGDNLTAGSLGGLVARLTRHNCLLKDRMNPPTIKLSMAIIGKPDINVKANIEIPDKQL